MVEVGVKVHEPVLSEEVVRVIVQSVRLPVWGEVRVMVPVATVPGNCGARVTVYVMGWP